MEQLRAEGAMGANMANGFGGNLSAALSNLGLPPVDGPSSAVAQRKRANRGGRLTDIIKVRAYETCCAVALEASSLAQCLVMLHGAMHHACCADRAPDVFKWSDSSLAKPNNRGGSIQQVHVHCVGSRQCQATLQAVFDVSQLRQQYFSLIPALP